MNTYDVKIKDLTDLRICGNLAFKISCIGGIGELQLQGVLASPKAPFIWPYRDLITRKYYRLETSSNR